MRFTRLKDAALAASLLAAAGFVAAASAPAAYAQTETTGALSGSVVDQTGAVVPNATVVVTDPSTNAQQTVVTNAEGHYSVGLLKPGPVKVSASAAGLQSDTIEASVILGTTVPLEIKVTPKGDKTIVEVTSTALPLVDTQNVALATSFSETQIQELPTPGGDVTTVAFTAPGVVVNAGGSYGNFSSDGLPGISNLFVLNGFDNQDPFLNLNNSGSSNLTLGQGELQEATVVQNGYNSQYGRAAGAIINYTTKSGGNKFHGEALYNYNGSALNANGWFNKFSEVASGQPNQPPHAVSNEWAANAGGPIVKDKVFFFADYEGLHYVLPNSGYLTTPSTALENYTLANIKSEGLSSSVTDFANQTFGIYNSAASKFSAQNVSGACGSLAGVEVSKGVYFDSVPKGDTGTTVPCMQQGFASANNINIEWLNTDRIDWVINDKQKAYGRFKVDHGSQPTYTSYINPLFDAVSIQPEYEGQFNHSYMISGNKTNVFVAAANWYSAYFGPASNAASAAVYPFFGITDAGVDGSGTAHNGGLSLLGVPSGLTQGRNVAQYQLEDDFNWIVGKHTLKFGANFRRDLVSDYDQEEETVFPELLVLGLQDFSQFELGPSNDYFTVNSFNQAFTNATTAHLALYNVGMYFQDEWQVTPKVKFTLGARVDRTGNPLCHNGCFSEFAPGTFGSGTLTDAYNASASGPIDAQNWHPFPAVQHVNFQPRFGINYSFDEKTEIRTGVGIFSDLYPASFIDGVIQNFPNYFAPAITNGAVAPSGASNVVSDAASANATVQAGFKGGQGWGAINNSLVNQGVLLTSPPSIGAYFGGEFKVPEYLEFSLQVQRQLSRADALILTYAGNYGYDEVLINPLVNPSTGFFCPVASYQGVALCPKGAASGSWTGNAPPIQGVSYVPTNQNFGRVQAFTNNGHSNYNGFLATYKRNAHGLTGEITYGWSHALDTVSNSGVGLPWNGASVTTQVTPSLSPDNLNYSNSDYDVRHNLTADGVWDLPFKSSTRAIDSLIGGWTLGSKAYWRNGEPFTVATAQSGDYGGLGISQGSGILLAQTAPGVDVSHVKNLAPSNAHGCILDNACLNGADYVPNGNQNTFGNVRRNSLQGPHYADFDASVLKTIVKTEGVSFRLGASAFNLFNHANFNPPGATVGSSSFGYISSVQAPATSPYGSFQGAAVTQRLLVVQGKIVF
jgi:outer membrane receptor protein involved in Fe transport